MTKEERYKFILDYFQRECPNAGPQLHFGSAFQLVCATLLSAQCTDKRINEVTPDLFRRYPDAFSMAQAEPEDILTYIKSVSYPNAKAEHLSKMAKRLVEAYNGVVPETMEELTTLPGVGRKTANVVLAVWFNKPNMPVDTHVFRVAHRLGLVTPKAKTPFDVEQQLLKNIPDELMSKAHHWLLLHGRYICQSRKPHCEKCAFAHSVCKSAASVFHC